MISKTVSLEQLARLATNLAASIAPPLTICLWGDLGAGKTTFARFFIQSLLSTPEDIPSPTFTLIQTYDSFKGDLWHCDLYRLKTPEEVEELGLIEAFSHAICLIEWPERIMAYLPKNRLDVKLSINPDQTRTVEYITHGSTSLCQLFINHTS